MTKIVLQENEDFANVNKGQHKDTWAVKNIIYRVINYQIAL